MATVTLNYSRDVAAVTILSMVIIESKSGFVHTLSVGTGNMVFLLRSQLVIVLESMVSLALRALQ